MSGITEGLESLGSKFTSGLNNIVTGLGNLKDAFVTSITNLIDSIISGLSDLGTFLLDGIKSLFLPSDGFFENEVNELRSRFSFADSIIASASGLINIITASAAADEQEPPSIVMDINIRGTTKEVTVIDMSWYEPYKRYGDMVLSGMIWVFFVWRVFVRLPGIIAGMAGTPDIPIPHAPSQLMLESRDTDLKEI